MTVDFSLNNYCFENFGNDNLDNNFTCPSKNYQQSFLLDSTGSVDLKIETLNYDYISIEVNLGSKLNNFTYIVSLLLDDIRDISKRRFLRF